MQYLVRIGITDTTENVLVGERTLQGVIGRAQHGGEGVAAGVEHLDSAGVERLQAGFATDNVKRGAALRARLGQREPSVVKLECGQLVPAARFRSGRAPMQAAGDFEMDYQPYFPGDADRNS